MFDVVGRGRSTSFATQNLNGEIFCVRAICWRGLPTDRASQVPRLKWRFATFTVLDGCRHGDPQWLEAIASANPPTMATPISTAIVTLIAEIGTLPPTRPVWPFTRI